MRFTKNSGHWPEFFFPNKALISALIGLVVGLVCLTAYIPGLRGPFLLDDTANIESATTQHDELLHVADAVFGNDSGVLRRPVSNLSFVLNAQLIGTTAYDFKLVNVFIHLLNGLLVWTLMSRLLLMLAPKLSAPESRAVAAVTAIAWMVHPLQVSTVLYAVQRMTQLSAFFLFAALVLTLWSLNKLLTQARPGNPWLHLLCICGLVMLAVLSKENGATFPLMLLTITLCLPASNRTALLSNRSTRQLLTALVVVPILVGALLVLVFFPELTTGYAKRSYSMAERLLTQPFVLLHYLYTILLPQVSSMGLYLDDFPLRQPGQLASWAGMLLTCTTMIVAISLRNRTPIFSFGVLWFLAAHAIESTFLPLEIAFEHRNHVAMLGPIVVVAYYARLVLLRFKPREQAALAAIPLMLLWGQTLHRAHTWSSNELFIKHEIANHPKSLRALLHAASFDADNNNIDSAALRIQQAQALAPESFWYQAMSLNLTCGGASPPLDWDRLVEIAAKNPSQLGIDSSMKTVVDLVVENRCNRLDVENVDTLLKELSEIAEVHSNRHVAERLTVLRYQLSLHKDGDVAIAETILNEAITVNSSGIEALELFAKVAIESNRLQKAAELINELEVRIRGSRRPTLLYKVQELRRSVADRSAMTP